MISLEVLQDLWNRKEKGWEWGKKRKAERKSREEKSKTEKKSRGAKKKRKKKKGKKKPESIFSGQMNAGRISWRRPRGSGVVQDPGRILGFLSFFLFYFFCFMIQWENSENFGVSRSGECMATAFLFILLKCCGAASCVPLIGVELLSGIVWLGGVDIREWASPSTSRRGRNWCSFAALDAL